MAKNMTKKSVPAKKTVKKANKQANIKNSKINNFLFGHGKITKTDILEVIMFLVMAIFMLFVYLKVQEVI
ncbi:MAG: hypothetical protein KAS12_00060 [Candidatus Aenigmarchaeota archaeon]|nr:hypothetical protein [Candidatus Aenigmarchaeota archaeon]